MKKILALMLAMLMVLSACSTGTTDNTPTSDNTPASSSGDSDSNGGENEEVATAGDDVISYSDDQEYSTVYSGEVTTLNYLVTSSTNEFGLAANFIDTLVDYDKYGVLQPSLAEDWEASDDGLVWTFHLRKGVKWYTYDGEEYADTTAHDFVDAAKYIFNSENGSKTANIAYRVIKNAEAYYNGDITDFDEVGVKALDDYTLEYTLENPVPYFESMLTYSCFFPVNGAFLAEQGDQFGTMNDTLLYNGAYILSQFEPQNKRVLEANANYWDKDHVYIQKVNYKYNKEADTIAQELYKRGEISQVEIPSNAIDAWMQDDELKDQVRPANTSFYTYFYALNFDPQFDEAYEPDNWKVAVNNENFRKSIFHALDRKAAMTTAEPYSPENRISNTVTPAGFVAYEGKDYTQMEGLAAFSNTDSFDTSAALDYKEKAMTELKDQVTFPVKVMMPYNAGLTENTQRAQVVQQQLQKALGTDYIEVYIVPYPPSGFLNNTRRAGNYAIEEVNWGPDYADPETYTDMFVPGSTYNFPEKSTEVDADGNLKFDVYMAMVDEAKGETVDLEKRYQLFADAESYLIDNAWVVPYGVGGGGYVASLLHPFEAAYSPFGVSSARWKGMRILSKPLNTEQYFAEKEKWEQERTDALKAAN